MKINEVIKNNRISSGLTQADLAKKLNVTRQTISKWELGLNEPDIDTIKKLAIIFGITTDELLITNTCKQEKKHHSILFLVCSVLFIFNIGILFIYLRYLDDVIPAHYNGSFEIDRYGSKYETLLFIVPYMIYYGIALLGYYMTKKDIKNKKNSIILYVFSIIIQVIFGGYIVILNSRYLQDNSLYSFFASIIGLVILILAILVHPRVNVSQNTILGVVTKLTLSNEIAWKRVNRVCAISLLVFSIIQITVCFILPLSIYSMLTVAIFIPVFLIIYIYHKKIELKLKDEKSEG